jgi:hypothetical protein
MPGTNGDPMTRPSIPCAAAVFLSGLACLGPRDPGPLEEEWGEVLFWEVTALDSSVSSCTDAASFADALTLPPLEEHTFFVVRVADDGKTATAMDCTETRAESCTAIDGFVFEIDGHTLEYVQPPEEIDGGGGCDVSVAPVWTMVDDGDIGALQVAISFPFEGEDSACGALDDGIAAQGTNGEGLMDCQLTLDAELAFSNAD